jgi:hypothetical protein
MQETKIVINRNGHILTFCHKSFDVWLQNSWHIVPFGPKGRRNKLYLSRAVHTKEKSCSISIHREVLGLCVGDGKIVDHKNGDGLDNRMSNLRLCTRAQNAQNSKKKKDTKSIYKGVTYNKRKGIKSPWKVQISSVELDIVIRKDFKTELEAAVFRDKMAKLLHGEFAILNFP